MKKLFTYALLFFILRLESQNTVLVRVNPENNRIAQIKWYYPDVISAEGFNVFRKEINASNWEKINIKPVVFKQYKIPNEIFTHDIELKNYLELAENSRNIKDLTLLAILIKSFRSDEFSKYLGIRFDDSTFESNKEYEYKITLITNEGETTLGVSEKVLLKNYAPINAPKNITFKTGNKRVIFKWEPEPNNYFGVNIYRRSSDTGQFRRITKDPIILSKTKNNKGEETYSDGFFVDEKLISHTKYYYQFEALDFFGSPSILSPPLLVLLKDLEPPKPPDSIYNSLNGKKVSIKWKKKNKEDDLAGYTIYRTNKNDTDFVKINRTLIPVNDSIYIDSVPRFGSYMYAISCNDRDSNETVSNPFHIEVYDNDPPLKPQKVTIEAHSGRLVVRWNKNTEEDLRGYLIYRTVNKNSEDTYVKVTPDPLVENFYTDSLPENIRNKFLYKVVAVDQSLNRSPYSEFAIARMPDVVAPNAPFLKTIFTNEKKYSVIEWIPNVEPDLAGYNIYRKNLDDSIPDFVKLTKKFLNRNSFRFTDRNAEENTLYQYFLEAIDSSGSISKKSNSIKFKRQSTNTEEDIKITHFETSYNATRNRVVLKWSLKNNENYASVVYKLKQGEASFAPISGRLEEHILFDTDVNSGMTYTYQIRVYTKKGDVYRSEKIALTIK